MTKCCTAKRRESTDWQADRRWKKLENLLKCKHCISPPKPQGLQEIDTEHGGDMKTITPSVCCRHCHTHGITTRTGMCTWNRSKRGIRKIWYLECHWINCKLRRLNLSKKKKELKLPFQALIPTSRAASLWPEKDNLDLPGYCSKSHCFIWFFFALLLHPNRSSLH